MADDNDEIPDFEFNFNDDETIINNGTIKETKLCKSKFPFEDTVPDVPEVENIELLEDRTQCITDYSRLIDDVVTFLDRPLKLQTDFHDKIEQKLSQFIFDVYCIIMHNSATRIENQPVDLPVAPFTYDKVIDVMAKLEKLKYNDMLSNMCRSVISSIGKAYSMTQSLPTGYNVFKFSADRTAMVSQISSRMIADKLDDDIKFRNNTMQSGLVKTLIEFMGNQQDSEISVNALLAYNVGQYAGRHGSKFSRTKAEIEARISEFVKEINEFAFLYKPELTFEIVTGLLKKEKLCGEDVDYGTFQDLIAPGEEYSDDNNYRTIDELPNEDMLKLPYWRKYATRLTTVSAAPNYWCYGLILPYGPYKAPVIWKALAVMPSRSKLMVLFLTINGMIVFPVMYEFRMKPEGDEGSFLVRGLRGSNKQIKAKTSSKVNPGNYDSESIDIRSEVTKLAKFEDDDLSHYLRCSLQNAPYVRYLNMWAKAAATILGVK